jgi:hypothetical protein
VHRLVAFAFLGKSDLQVNHINSNRSDNRLENLEFVNQRENNSHRFTNEKIASKFVGVCWNKKTKKWISHIRIKRKTIYLGSFENELDARNAYIKALKENNLTNKYAI